MHDKRPDPPAAGPTPQSKSRKTVVIVAALLVLTVAAATGWGAAWWLNHTRTPILAVGAQARLELNPVFQDSDSAIIAAIERRNSTLAGDFTDRPVAEDVQAALGWAATGKNRDGTGFVVPLAMGAEPYVSVYLATSTGVSRFDWKTNELVVVSADDVRSVLVTPGYAKQAPCLMLFVIDQDSAPGGADNGYIAVGAMTQNVYLLADELNVQTRFIASIDHDQFRDQLRLSSTQIPAGAIVMAAK
ncbi:MAG: nitroreductase family protein [Propionibacteriaceae bacterium]|jgi:hypothetical protein|nr:nitroreductase family protein [Propionibacteriaceae bacterium]